jgi:hypothetical protein
MERKVRTAERRVLVERLGLCLVEVSVRRRRNLHKTVRATETSWVAPAETAKLLGLILGFPLNQGNPPRCNWRTSLYWKRSRDLESLLRYIFSSQSDNVPGIDRS